MTVSIEIPTEHLILMRDSGMTHQAIADIAGISSNAVKMRIRRYRANPMGRPKKWTEERIIAAMHDFHKKTGRPPSARDWNAAHARNGFRDDVAERFYENDWPGSNIVQYTFGSWNEGLRAAGFKPLRPGFKYTDSPKVRRYA